MLYPQTSFFPWKSGHVGATTQQPRFRGIFNFTRKPLIGCSDETLVGPRTTCPAGSLFRQKRRAVLLRIEFGHRNPQCCRQFQNFEICYPAHAALNSGDYSTRNVPSFKLANRSKFLLRPTAFIAKQHHLVSDNVSGGVHAPVYLWSFGLVIVWNSKQLVRYPRQLISIVPEVSKVV